VRENHEVQASHHFNTSLLASKTCQHPYQNPKAVPSNVLNENKLSHKC